MAGGRPTKATPQNVAKANDYVANPGKYGDNIPTVEGLSLILDISDDTIATRPEFSATLVKLRAEQKRKLMQNGLTGDYNPAFTKFLLSANHGMVEKSAVEQTGDSKLTVEIVKFGKDTTTV